VTVLLEVPVEDGDGRVGAGPLQRGVWVKLGGETGTILAKGTAEVNLKITMTWDRQCRVNFDERGMSLPWSGC